MTIERDGAGNIIGVVPRDVFDPARRCGPARHFVSVRLARRAGKSYRFPRVSRYIVHDPGREWRMDEVILSRLETEWLVAWFYDRSRQMPPQVQELLKSIGFIDGDNLTAAGRRWLQTRGPVSHLNCRAGGQDRSGAGHPSHARRL